MKDIEGFWAFSVDQRPSPLQTDGVDHLRACREQRQGSMNARPSACCSLQADVLACGNGRASIEAANSKQTLHWLKGRFKFILFFHSQVKRPVSARAAVDGVFTPPPPCCTIDRPFVVHVSFHKSVPDSPFGCGLGRCTVRVTMSATSWI